MPEMIDIYNENGEKLDTISKKQYYYQEWDNIPWIKCATCFIVDSKTNKILFEKRGNNFLDPGKVDLCSGHIQSAETETQGMLRELNEELNINPEQAYQSLNKIGEIKIDYSKLDDETNRKPLRCFVSIFKLEMKDVTKIKVDNDEAISMAWIDINEAIELIRNNMTRIPYEGELKQKFEDIFKKLLNKNKDIKDQKENKI